MGRFTDRVERPGGAKGWTVQQAVQRTSRGGGDHGPGGDFRADTLVNSAPKKKIKEE
jgi:hypothetical protein